MQITINIGMQDAQKQPEIKVEYPEFTAEKAGLKRIVASPNYVDNIIGHLEEARERLSTKEKDPADPITEYEEPDYADYATYRPGQLSQGQIYAKRWEQAIKRVQGLQKGMEDTRAKEVLGYVMMVFNVVAEDYPLGSTRKFKNEVKSRVGKQKEPLEFSAVTEHNPEKDSVSLLTPEQAEELKITETEDPLANYGMEEWGGTWDEPTPPANPSKKKPRISDEERERRRQRMKAMHEARKLNAAKKAQELLDGDDT